MHTVTGTGLTAPGVDGSSQRTNGVQGRSGDAGASGVYGENSGGGFGIAGRSLQPGGVGVLGEGAGLAGRFIGIVEVTGDIRLSNADFAEDFDISGTEPITPGTVMVLDDHGALRPSATPYDKRVAGVVSGAGSFEPGIILDRHEINGNRMPIALLGKVYCMTDASYCPIEVGDMLTSSPTAGHGMKATDPALAFGAILGKALRPVREGRELIPILVALQEPTRTPAHRSESTGTGRSLAPSVVSTK
jgi:hypothetical protein